MPRRRRAARGGQRPLGLLPYAAVAAVALTACSLIVDADQNELGRKPQACESGETVFTGCVCPGGEFGAQECDVTGAYKPECLCDGATAGAGGAGAGSSAGAGDNSGSGSAGNSGNGNSGRGNSGP